MGWLKDFFNPGGAYERERKEVQDRLDKQLEEGLARGDVHWVVWKYVRNSTYNPGASAFYDWMLAVRKGLKSGEIDPKEIVELFGLENFDGKD